MDAAEADIDARAAGICTAVRTTGLCLVARSWGGDRSRPRARGGLGCGTRWHPIPASCGVGPPLSGWGAGSLGWSRRRSGGTRRPADALVDLLLPAPAAHSDLRAPR